MCSDYFIGWYIKRTLYPTEAAAVAVFYALVVTLLVMRTLKVSALLLFVDSAVQSGVILLLVGASVSLAWMITVSGLGGLLTESMMTLTDNVLLLLLLLNLLLLLVGMFLTRVLPCWCLALARANVHRDGY